MGERKFLRRSRIAVGRRSPGAPAGSFPQVVETGVEELGRRGFEAQPPLQDVAQLEGAQGVEPQGDERASAVDPFRGHAESPRHGPQERVRGVRSARRRLPAGLHRGEDPARVRELFGGALVHGRKRGAGARWRIRPGFGGGLRHRGREGDRRRPPGGEPEEHPFFALFPRPPEALEEAPGRPVAPRGQVRHVDALEAAGARQLPEPGQHAVLHPAAEGAAAQEKRIDLERPARRGEEHRAHQAVVAETVADAHHEDLAFPRGPDPPQLGR